MAGLNPTTTDSFRAETKELPAGKPVAAGPEGVNTSVFPKVCLITSVHHPLDTRIFHREARSLASHGFEVSLLAPGESRETRRGRVKISGFPAALTRTQRWLNLWRIFSRALGERADIYHFHDPELIPWGLLLQLITGKPVLYDVHEHNPDAIRLKEWLPGWGRHLLAGVFDRAEIAAASLFAGVITADEAVANRFHAHHRLVVLFNFPRADFGAVKPGPGPRRHHAVQLVYVGSNSWDRGQWLMLEVVRILVAEKNLDVGLWIIGKFDSEGKRREFAAAVCSDALLRNRVVCPGIIPQEQLGAWLAAADVGLVPLQPVAKFHKNIPTKMFEYMAAGLPIVASDLPPIRKFLLAANAGLLAVPVDPRSHAEKILSLVEDPELAGHMGQNGRRAFQTRFNWGSEERKLISLYRELLNLPQPLSPAPPLPKLSVLRSDS